MNTNQGLKQNLLTMQRKYFLLIVCLAFTTSFFGQLNKVNTADSFVTVVKRPKLVVGIVVDQMRWDYLYRYYNRYAADGGFKRLLNRGFACQNTMIPFTPTVTACGHGSIYTGSVPAINGITGNDWWDYDQRKLIYCTEDTGAATIGTNSDLGKMSPKNLLVTTICDELRLATNFRSKVIGIAIKDRSAILPAGHSANAAYWYDNTTGDWITSSYYMNELPGWVKDFNAKKSVDKYYEQDWTTLYPLNTYEQSSTSRPTFQLSLKQFTGKNYKAISATPYGNTFTFDMAKAAINGEQLGAGAATDFFTLSLSSPDYIGHSYGPNSVEEEDCYLRLDKDLGGFLNFLDSKFGKDEYLLFLTADHGVANMPAFLMEHKIPSGYFDDQGVSNGLNNYLSEKFNVDNLVTVITNYQVYLDRNLVSAKKINKAAVYNAVIEYMLQDPAVDRAFALDALNQTTLNATLKEAYTNGYYPSRSGDIQIVLKPQRIDGFLNGGSTHGVWNPYDAHIPLIWFGWNIQQGKTNRNVYITDIAPTVAALLNIQMPSGSIGHVIEEVVK